MGSFAKAVALALFCAAEAAKRTYTIYGKKSLGEAAWTAVSSGSEGLYRFFKVVVEVK